MTEPRVLDRITPPRFSATPLPRNPKGAAHHPILYVQEPMSFRFSKNSWTFEPESHMTCPVINLTVSIKPGFDTINLD